MSAYLIICLGLLLLSIFLGLTAVMATGGGDLENKSIVMAITIAVPTIIAMIAYAIWAYDSGPSEAQQCGDAGNIWYDPTYGAEVCYTPENYEIVMEYPPVGR